MKRAWPYALALAVVVTGCYLALAPLLRSLSPSPAGSQATSALVTHDTTTVTVGSVNASGSKPNKAFTKNEVKSQVKGKTQMTGHTAAQAKAKARAKAKALKALKAKRAAHKSAQTPTQDTGGFVTTHSSGGSSSTSTHSSSTGSSTPPANTSSSKPKVTRSNGPIGGETVNTADNGGLAGGNCDATLPAGNSSQLADNN